MYYTRFDTPLCEMVLFWDENGLSRLHLVTDSGNRELPHSAPIERRDDIFTEAKAQLLEYAAGKRKTFDLRLNPEWTEYQKKVWNHLREIPYGAAYSYKDIAEMTWNPKASRAVGMANGKNPIPVIVPCHRVIGSDGKLTGFAFGLELKKKLLDLERENI